MNSGTTIPNRRKRLLIYPQFQLRYIASSMIGTLVVIVICFVSNHYLFRHFELRGLERGLPPDHVFFRFLAEQRSFTGFLLVGVAVLTTAFLGLYGLIQSHRIAGPLSHLRRYLEDEIAGKNSKPLAFRPGDYFIEIADLVNQALRKKSSTEDK